LIGIVVTNGKHAKRLSSERDRIAWPPVRHGSVERRRIGRRPVLPLEGVSTRAAAALFAMQHGLVASGELPIVRHASHW
jgi:hypothetical protein